MYIVRIYAAVHGMFVCTVCTNNQNHPKERENEWKRSNKRGEQIETTTIGNGNGGGKLTPKIIADFYFFSSGFTSYFP